MVAPKRSSGILRPEEIKKDTVGVGGKAKGLAILAHAGFAVPEFVVLPATTIDEWRSTPAAASDITRAVLNACAFSLYAVRSAAMQEDERFSSQAGQFLTQLAVTPKALEAAIAAVITQAGERHVETAKEFSVIVQRYLPADIAGVCFTRQPEGGRAMVIEYHQGGGEELVSGKIAPHRAQFYYHQRPTGLPVDPQVFARVEALFGFPQDIEWCRVGKHLFLLQSRPITTITKEMHDEIRYLESVLPQTPDTDYDYAKNHVSEISPRPTPLTFSLLTMIFAHGGPVMRAYAKWRIEYRPEAFLVLFGNELFVDQEAELKSLLPAFSLLNRRHRPRWHSWRGILASLGNIWRLALLKADPALITKLDHLLSAAVPNGDFSEAVRRFDDSYEAVFEVNLLAARSSKKVELLLRKEQILVAAVLAASGTFDCDQDPVYSAFAGQEALIGNTLECADENPFVSARHPQCRDQAVEEWWQSLPQYKRKLFRKPIQNAIIALHYCEIARMVMLRHLGFVRQALLAISPYNDKRLAYFHSIAEINRNEWNEQICRKRQADFLRFQQTTLPARLTGRVIDDEEQSLQGLSPGCATGTLVSANQLEAVSGPKILSTRLLTPDLARHFDAIVGIVSETGGLLSHLAIIAREQHIPVVVAKTQTAFPLGTVVTIDGSVGTITTVKNSSIPTVSASDNPLL